MASAALDKKAIGVILLDVANLIGVCDYFLIMTASSSQHTDALTDELERRAKELSLKTSGLSILSISRDMDWTLLDFGDIVVHIFSEEARNFYQLERLWKDAPMVNVKE